MELLKNKSKHSPKRRLTLAWEISLVLVLKIALLWLLWDLFFSSPVAKHMHVPEPQVTQHLLSASPSNPTQENRHDR